MNNRLIKSNDAGGGGACTNTVDLYNPFPDGGGVALYQLNGDATDVSGNYDGTASNVTYGAGQFGQAGVFNGSSSGINTPIPFLNAKATSSVSLWVKYTDTTAYKTLYQDWSSNNNWNHNIIANWPSTGNLRFFSAYGGSGGYVTFETSGLTLNDGNWHNIVGTVDVSTRIYKGYVDGVEVGSMTVSSNAWTGVTQNANIGNENGSANFFNGSIDQVRIFSRALRPYEVEALYTEEYCTPTIVPSEHFNTVTYDGNGSTQSITGVGFQPDLVWAKRRSSAEDNVLFDSVRGVQNQLVSNKTNAESTKTNALSSFDSDGFTTGDNNALNTSGQNYVSWNFKAGGTAVSNTDGTITSQVSANTEAGFSIVSYTTQSSGTATVGHGLNVEPNIVLVKTTGVADSWRMYHSSLGANYQIYLNLTNAAGVTANQWNNTAPTNSVFSLGTDNAGSYATISYCFAEVEGFSSFGSYVGNRPNTNTIVTGFEPAFVMIKDASTAGEDWIIVDNKRDGANAPTQVLFPSNSNAETSYTVIEFLENGFTVGNTGLANTSGATIIYMAFAADPTTVEPTLEDSFNTVLYTGDGTSNQQITGVGFQPDLVWTKDRVNTGTGNFVQDSVRGFSGASPNWAYSLITDSTIAESTTGQTWRDAFGGLSSFDSDGFSLWTGNTPSGSAFNKSGADYVAWNWKGAEIPAINSNGSIPSVVSANPAAGFSIVSYTGTDVNNTIGHGLGISPDVIIIKDRTVGRNWRVYHSAIGAGKNLKLNTPDAASSDAAIFLSTTPTENVFYVGASGDVNANTDNFIAYCFAEVAGFSKFGSYSGTGGAGNAQVLGFEPAFVMAKRTDSASGWLMVDNKRNGTANYELFAHSSDAEYAYDRFLFNANGFEFNSGAFNESGSSWIYMAFANQF